VDHSALFVTTISLTLEAFLLPLAENLRSAGWRVDALACGATTNEHLATGFDRRFDVKWSRNPLAPSNLLGAASRVRDVVAEGSYDVVHVHTPVAAFLARYALRRRRLAGRPVVIYTAHGFHFYEGGRRLSNALFGAAERLAAGWTDYLVTVNAEDFDAASRMRRIDPRNVRFIPGIGVDTDRFSPTTVTPPEASALRAKIGVSADAFMLVMVAELAPVKRHVHVLEALHSARDPRVHLVLVGEGPLEGTLREKAEALGLGDVVHFVGYRRDVASILAASDAVILASEREGLARSVLEGMASGKPIVGTRTRGIADAVGEDGGWIVDKHDVAALGRAIAHAASHPDEVAARGAAARKRAVRDYALPRIIDAYAELYREALA